MKGIVLLTRAVDVCSSYFRQNSGVSRTMTV